MVGSGKPFPDAPLGGIFNRHFPFFHVAICMKNVGKQSNIGLDVYDPGLIQKCHVGSIQPSN